MEGAHLQCKNNHSAKFEYKGMKTRHHKSVSDRPTNEWTDGRSGPTTRPAFAKATQVKTLSPLKIYH